MDEAKHIADERFKNKEMFKRAGYRYIYKRLTDSGVFTGYRTTPAQSVRAIPTSQALEQLSLENALVT